MRISILTPDISDNCLGRAYLLAKVLQSRYEVEIIGPTFYGDRIWPPCDTGEVTYKVTAGYYHPRFLLSARKLLRLISGDVIYAIKPRPASFGLGLWQKMRRGKPLILDIDDWEVGGYAGFNRLRRIGLFLNIFDPNSYGYTWLMEKMIPYADAITTVSSFLQQRFGGVIVPHGRDTEHFNPARFNGLALRAKHGLDRDKKVVMFLGTLRRHKGIEDLLAATEALDEVQLVIAGVDWDHPLARRIANSHQGKVRFFGMLPFHQVPEYLSMADVIVVPQREYPFSQGQIPAKIFDAMAMAKPIISTTVSDIPTILHGCGFIVEPGNPQQLARKLRFVLENEDLAAHMGAKAREKCVKEYSWAKMEERLLQVFSKFGKPGGGQNAREQG